MSDQDWDPRAEEALDPNLKTGVGNPLSPYNTELLSVEDEKRIDDKGLKVAEGLLWSQSGTGWFLWIALWVGDELTQLVPGGRGQSDIDLSKHFNGKWNLSLGISEGRPRFSRPTVGAALELPMDLAEDPIKKQYVAEWVVNTIVESFQQRRLEMTPEVTMDLAVLVEAAGDRAIGTLL